jgi:tetratricopeptide (TPR) repeat protein
MKKLFLLLIFPLMSTFLLAQNLELADKLVEEGIVFHDKNDYKSAIEKYDKALEADKDNLRALAEKALTLLSLEKYEESIKLCKKAIETYPKDDLLSSVYVTCGNAYDMIQQPEKALDMYNQGLKIFPSYYQLYFNKGIFLAGLEKFDESMKSFQSAVLLNPYHASSHNAIGRLAERKKANIPTILVLSRFFMLEPQTKRAEGNLESLKDAMKGNVEKGEGKNVTINLSAEMLSDTTKDGSQKEDSFNSANLILSLMSATDFDKKHKKESDVERYIRKMEAICTSLDGESKNGRRGFIWEYYVPYFTEMQRKKLLEPFAYVVFASSKDSKTNKWLDTHSKELDDLYAWSKKFSWKKMQ